MATMLLLAAIFAVSENVSVNDLDAKVVDGCLVEINLY